MFVCKVLIVCCRGQPLPMAAIEVADVRVGSLLVFRCVDDSCHRSLSLDSLHAPDAWSIGCCCFVLRFCSLWFVFSSGFCTFTALTNI